MMAAIASQAIAATNVFQYTHDAAGNVTQILRQSGASALAITRLDPASGAVGAAATIFGSGFSATPASNTVLFNGITATVGAASTGSLAVTVPAGATTGRITVTVGSNTATSPADFVVTIPGVPTIASFTPTSGDAGTSVAVTGTNFDVAAGATTVKLNGVTATASVSATTGLAFTVPGATASGRVTAITSAGTGESAQDFIVPPPGVTASDVVTVARLSMGGSAANLVISTPSKMGLIFFDGDANTYYTLQFSQFASSPTSATISYQVVKPDNTVLTTGYVGYGYRPTIHLPKLPVVGTYSVLLSVGSATLNTNVRIVSDPVITVDGPAVASALDFTYQSMRFIFDATVGQRIGVGVTNVVGTPSTGSVEFRAYRPDGSSVSGDALLYCAMPWTTNPQGNCDGELVAPVTGTYTLVGVSYPGTYDNFAVLLSTDAAGSLAVDVPQDVTLTRVGQDARYTFAATAGDSLAIDVSGVVPQPQTQTFYAIVYKPDGSYFTSCSGSPPSGGYCELGAVPITGTYSVWIDPAFGAYGSLKLALKQGPALTVSDAPTALATASNSESARFRFSGTAGENIAIGISGLAYVGTSSSPTSLYAYGPDRTQVGGTLSCYPFLGGGSCSVSIDSLPVTGTYGLVLVPPGVVRITGNITVSPELAGTLTAGTPVSLVASRPGQDARFTFAGTVGESTSIKLLGVSTVPDGQTVYVVINRPSGSYFTSATATSAAPAFIDLPSLPATGTYSVLLYPAYGPTWQGQLVLDPGTVLTADGAIATLPAGATGEPLRFRFDGVTGQRIDLGLEGLAYAAASGSASSLAIYRPDGSIITWSSCYIAGTGSCDQSYASLPSSGTYSVILTPPVASAIAGGSLALSTPLSGTFVAGDPAQAVAISRPGQTARYTFSGTAAQLLRLNWTGTTVSGGASVAVSVLKPDGSALSSGSYLNGATGGFDIASLPATGTYTIVFDPGSAATTTAPSSLVTR